MNIWEHPYVTKVKGSCWLWGGAKNRKGYGMVSKKFFGGQQYVHRVSYLQAIGFIPPGILVCHHCDTPSCLNPEHLFLGTNSENQIDSVKKGRHWSTRKTHCLKGHSLTGGNLYVCPRGFRECKTCRRASVRRHKKK